MTDTDNEREQPASGDNAPDSGTATRISRGYGLTHYGSARSTADAASGENDSGNARGVPSSAGGTAAADSSGDSETTERARASSRGSAERGTWGERLRRLTGNSGRNRQSSEESNQTQTQAKSHTKKSLEIEFGDSDDIPPLKRRGRPLGTTIGTTKRKTYERLSEIAVRIPFKVAAIWTHFRDFSITDEEWKELRDPAANIAERLVPMPYAEKGVLAYDVWVFANVLTDIYDKKMQIYRMAKYDAEMEAKELQANLDSHNTNGYREVPVSAILR